MGTSSARVRLSSLWRTLRFRLAAWNAAIIILTALVTLFGVRQGVRRALLNELDQVLVDDLREVRSVVNDTAAVGLASIQEYLTRMADSHERHGWYVKLFASSGERVWASPGARPDRPALALTDQQEPVSFEGYRILGKSLDPPQAGVNFVRVGATLRFLDQDMARIDRLVLLAAGAVLITAPPCGYWLAARATRPVGQIIQTASRLRPSHLDERLTLRGSGDELDQLAQTINTLLDRIAAYIDTKRDFLANAAHELRTPLAAIRSSVEVALGGDRTSSEYEDLLADVIDECSSLETLVNQLLLLVETEAGLPVSKYEPVDLRDLSIKAIDMFTGAAEVRGIGLQRQICDAAVVRGNKHHLRQVINNLLDNAVKYTNPGGQIHVTLACRLEEQQVCLTVANTGPGIAADDLQYIFERFYRAESSRTRGTVTGTGLGLSICQSIVNIHGGTIECDSQPNQGATFTVCLPMSAAG